MTIQNFQAEWTQLFKDTMLSVERAITPAPDDDPEISGFKALSKWMMETTYNTYSFMPQGYESYRSNPFEADSIISLIHHALIDDGEISFVKMIHNNKVVRVFMTFIWQHEDNFNQHCIDENKPLIDSMIKGSQRFRDFMAKNNPPKFLTEKPNVEVKDFKFVVHRDPVQFVKDVEEYEIAHNLKQTQIEEKINNWKSKAKP